MKSPKGHEAYTNAERILPREVVENLGRTEWEKRPTTRLDKGMDLNAMSRDMAFKNVRFLD